MKEKKKNVKGKGERKRKVGYRLARNWESRVGERGEEGGIEPERKKYVVKPD